jgi:cell shape-determining protein MreD
MIITWSLPGFPALSFAAALISFIYANHHDEYSSVIFGSICGLMLDLFSPEILGVNMMAFAAASLMVSSLRRFFAFGNPAWYFFAGVSFYVARTLLVLFFHLIIDGTLIVSSDLRGYISAALWVGLLTAFYFSLTESQKDVRF